MIRAQQVLIKSVAGTADLMAHSFRKLSEAVKADPARRARIEEQKRALRNELAHARLQELRRVTKQGL